MSKFPCIQVGEFPCVSLLHSMSFYAPKPECEPCGFPRIHAHSEEPATKFCFRLSETLPHCEQH